MRAFGTAWRAIASFYNELFFLLSINIFWWVTGGVFVALAVVLGWSGFSSGVVWLFVLAPLVAIPAGPASAALANVARQIARDLHVDSSFYWDAFRLYWRQALALSAISMVVLALLLLNCWFYWTHTGLMQLFAFFWLYLAILWLGAQAYLYPTLAALKEPTVGVALRSTAVMAFANPLYTTVLFALAVVLTAVSIVLAILLPLAWPAVMMLLGEHSFMLFMERMGPGRGQEPGHGEAGNREV